MDSLTLIIFLLLLGLAIQTGQTLIAGAIALIIAISVRNLTLGLVILGGAALMIYMKDQIQFWWVILALLMLAAFLTMKGGETGPEMYTPEMLMGGY